MISWRTGTHTNPDNSSGWMTPLVPHSTTKVLPTNGTAYSLIWNRLFIEGRGSCSPPAITYTRPRGGTLKKGRFRLYAVPFVGSTFVVLCGTKGVIHPEELSGFV